VREGHRGVGAGALVGPARPPASADPAVEADHEAAGVRPARVHSEDDFLSHVPQPYRRTPRASGGHSAVFPAAGASSVVSAGPEATDTAHGPRRARTLLSPGRCRPTPPQLSTTEVDRCG